MAETFNIVVVAQAGRLEYEACLFAASLRAKSPKFKGKLFIAEPSQADVGRMIHASKTPPVGIY